MEEVKGSIPFSSTPNPQVTAGFRMSGVMLDRPMGGLLGGLFGRLPKLGGGAVTQGATRVRPPSRVVYARAMGIFSRSKEPKKTQLEKNLELLASRELKFASGDLNNLLATAGGGYVRQPPPYLTEAAEDVYRRLPSGEKDEDGWWSGVAFLWKYQDGRHDIVEVLISGKAVSKLTKESVAAVWDKLPAEQRIPVRCQLGMIGKGQYLKPSLDLYAAK